MFKDNNPDKFNNTLKTQHVAYQAANFSFFTRWRRDCNQLCETACFKICSIFTLEQYFKMCRYTIVADKVEHVLLVLGDGSLVLKLNVVVHVSHV